MIANPEPSRTSTTERPDRARPGDFGPSAAHIAQLQAQLQHYLSLEIDRLKVKARKAVIYALLALLAAVVAGAVVVAAAVFLLKGLAEAISALLGGSAWTGDLIVGAGILGALALAGWGGSHYIAKNSFARTRAKHERWQRQNGHGQPPTR